jgi:D-proline reductase (dithiol) PrdB
MARLERMPENERKHLRSLPCPIFETTPWVTGPGLAERRLALISTAGLHRRNDRPFAPGEADYRVIPGDISSHELVMSHISTNYDRTGFQQDWNVVFPLDRLRELVDRRIIGSLAKYHYSMMGATDPLQMEATARSLARIMKGDGVDAVLLVPV